ncbi:MAG: LPXTG cell wall anchor domain-containing protein [Bifidobacteriaceae bacterium]|nr:LPXTG cell wall anchor domain-containing protein [Bifidobacteriaceae bacterium]
MSAGVYDLVVLGEGVTLTQLVTVTEASDEPGEEPDDGPGEGPGGKPGGKPGDGPRDLPITGASGLGAMTVFSLAMVLAGAVLVARRRYLLGQR